MQVAVAHRGFVHLEVETIGRAAHGSRPQLGIDAIAKMGRVLTGIEELDRRLRANPTDPHLGSGSAHASLIEGGQEYSSYPARCVAPGRATDDPRRDRRARGRGDPGDPRRGDSRRSRLRGRRALARVPRAVRDRRGRRDRDHRPPLRRARPRGRAGRRRRAVLGRLGAPCAPRGSRRCCSGRAATGCTPRSSGSTSPRSSNASRSTARSLPRSAASAPGSRRSPRRSPRVRPTGPCARPGRRRLEEVTQSRAVGLHEVVVREVRALTEDEQRRNAHVAECGRL